MCYITMEEQFLNPKDIAKTLKVSYMSVYRWIKAGNLKAYKVEKQYRVKKADLDEFLEEYKHQQKMGEDLNSFKGNISPSGSALLGKETSSPFIRFRHGTRLEIKPIVRDSIREFLKEYQQHKEQVFRNLIKDISDGSGWGIHPDSTWYKAIQELFETYRDWESPSRESAIAAVIEILEILEKEADSQITWDSVMKTLETKFEILSGWEYSHIKRLGGQDGIKRDKDGYYIEENGQRVNVIGTKTLEENAFDYIQDDIYRNHGSIGSLLKLIEMLFISLDFISNPQYYRKELSYVMNEADTNTWFLHGMWRVETSYEYIPISWHPRSCYTDIEWLKSEVITILAKKCKVNQEAIPQIPSTSDALSKWQEAFKNYALQYEVAFETDIILGSEPFGSTPDELYIDFEGRKVRWVNGTKYIYPSLIIPAKNDTYEEEREIARRFISALVFSEKYPIREITSAACPKRFAPLIRQPRSNIFLGVSAIILSLLGKKRTERQWQALSYYKEAINTESIYYRFLCYYNTIKLAFLNANNQEDTNKTDQWIDTQAPNLNISQLLTKITSQGTTLGAYLRHEGGRNAIAHVGMLRGNHPTIVPDNPDDHRRIAEVLPIVRELATKVIEGGMIS